MIEAADENESIHDLPAAAQDNASVTAAAQADAAAAAEADASEDDSDDSENVFKVLEKRADDVVVLLLKDGRAFIAKVESAIAGLFRKGSKVTVDHDGLDSDGVPTNPVVTGTVGKPTGGVEGEHTQLP